MSSLLLPSWARLPLGLAVVQQVCNNAREDNHGKQFLIDTLEEKLERIEGHKRPTQGNTEGE